MATWQTGIETKQFKTKNFQTIWSKMHYLWRLQQYLHQPIYYLQELPKSKIRELFFYVNLKLTSIQFVFGHVKNKLLNLLDLVKHSRCSSLHILTVTARSWTLWRSVCTQKWLPSSPATIGDLSSCCNCSKIFDCLALVRIPVCRQHYPPYTL